MTLTTIYRKIWILKIIITQKCMHLSVFSCTENGEKHEHTMCIFIIDFLYYSSN
jgi:hypothetical protein